MCCDSITVFRNRNFAPLMYINSPRNAANIVCKCANMGRQRSKHLCYQGAYEKKQCQAGSRMIKSTAGCLCVVNHFSDVKMSTTASQITGVLIVYLTVCLDADQRKYQSSMSLAFVMGSHRWPVNSPPKGPVTPKIYPFDDVIMW